MCHRFVYSDKPANNKRKYKNATNHLIRHRMANKQAINFYKREETLTIYTYSMDKR